MRKLLSVLLAVGSAVTMSQAQQVRPAASPRIYHELAQLKHLTSVLYLAAHPDDENTRLLAWLVNDRNIRTGYLSLTRGDGGQNILGSEQGAALGLIRTHELMEARKLDGAEQFFSRAIDFGFSKNYTETFKHWNEDTLTNDVVWVMRKFRPDVVICRFPPNAMAGHGQHAVSAIVAADAFKAAGDDKKYPAQLKYYPTWQPKRLLFNSYRFGDRNTTSENQFKLLVGQYLPLLGMSSGELAGVSRSQHKSQGAGTPSVPGVQTEYFKLVEGDTLSSSLFDGIDITWNRVGRPDIGKDIDDIVADYDFKRPDASLPALLAVRKKIETVKDDYWRTEKLDEINKAILDCTGFMAELYTRQPQAVDGAVLPFTLHVIARTHMPVNLRSIEWTGSDTAMNISIKGDTLLSFDHTISIPAGAPVTQPYWLAQEGSPALFNIPADTLLSLPETPDNLNALLKLQIGDEAFTVPVPLSYKKLDPVKGDVVEALRVVPDVSVEFTSAMLITQPDGSVTAGIRLRPFKNISDANLLLAANGKVVAQITSINLQSGNDTLIQATISKEAAGNKDFNITAMLATKDKSYNATQHLIQYSHIPTLQYFTPAYTKVLVRDWKCTAKRIGYIKGAGDLTADVLRDAGLEVDELKDADLTNAAKLKKYDAILTGVRMVNVDKHTPEWMPVLLQYVADGGTLVMQYNTLQDLSTNNFGPYPFTLSDERVTEEDATMGFVNPQSRLLNYPNKITQANFTDWVQERGLYFASKWDKRYETLFTMHDTNEEPLTGGTLYTKYGKGNYIYTSLSFFRQLPAGNKGAISLLMNMLSAGK